jgi:hypothetical protein
MCRRRNAGISSGVDASDPPSRYKSIIITCPSAQTCDRAGLFNYCYGEYDDDEPCAQYKINDIPAEKGV